MLKTTQWESSGMHAFMLRWLSVGLGIALTMQPAEAMPPSTAKDRVAEREEPEGVASPVSNPEIADPLTLDAGHFLFGDWGGWRGERADDGITFDFQWTQHAQGVVDGGTDTGFGHGGTLDYDHHRFAAARPMQLGRS